MPSQNQTPKQITPGFIYLVLAVLLMSSTGCEWDCPLSSAKEATADPDLLGNWKAKYAADFIKHIELNPNKHLQATFLLAIGSLKEVNYTPDSLPAGAMFVDAATQHQFGNHADIICWPTRYKNASYLNYVNYDLATKKLGKHYTIAKYHCRGNSVTFFIPNKDVTKKMRKQLGANYNSNQLLEEFSNLKPEDWIIALKCERIQSL